MAVNVINDEVDRMLDQLMRYNVGDDLSDEFSRNSWTWYANERRETVIDDGDMTEHRQATSIGEIRRQREERIRERERIDSGEVIEVEEVDDNYLSRIGVI